MNLHNLKPAAGATHREGKRLGRGNASGKGGTSTKGNKGAQSRAGYNYRRGSEGGQMPLHRRLPKRGFKNINTIKYKTLNLSQLEAIAKKFELHEIDTESLYVLGYISRTDLIKILGNGTLTAKLNIKANAVTATAKMAIENAGGSIEII